MRTVLWIAVILFPVSEISLTIFKRANKRMARVEDRGSMRALWTAIGLGVGLAVACQWLPAARIRVPYRILGPLALALFLAGFAIRWTAILALGKLFTVDVAIRQDHPLVDTGLYRYVRHPAYLGSWLSFLGLGVFFANWLSLAGLLVPIALAMANRIAKEEKVLLQALGAPYKAYCARTKRLIPGLF
jgi:protein-S-isoprenylcysteine O-methyltransferase Ste14